MRFLTIVGYSAATPVVVVGSPAATVAGSVGRSVGVPGHSAGAEEPTVAASCRSRPQFEQPNLSAAFTVEHRLQVHPSDNLDPSDSPSDVARSPLAPGVYASRSHESMGRVDPPHRGWAGIIDRCRRPFRRRRTS